MNKGKEKKIIKKLLSGRLTKKQRKAFADWDSVSKEIKKQWNKSGNDVVDITIKEQIWRKIKERCEHREVAVVLVELGKKQPVKP